MAILRTCATDWNRTEGPIMHLALQSVYHGENLNVVFSTYLGLNRITKENHHCYHDTGENICLLGAGIQF